MPTCPQLFPKKIDKRKRKEKMKMNQEHHDEPVPSYDVNIYRTELLTNEYFPALLHYLKKKVSISKARRMERGAKFVQIILLSK